MVTIPNTFQAQTPIGQSISNLGTAIFGNRLSPSEREKLKLANRLTQARIGSAEAKTAGAQAALAGQRSIGDILGQARQARKATSAPILSPDFIGPSRPETLTAANAAATEGQNLLDTLGFRLAEAGASTVGDPQDLANLLNFAQANTAGVPDTDVLRSLAGRGNATSVNEAVSLAGQDRVRAANAADAEALALAKIAATPLSLSQAGARDLELLEDEQRAERLGPTFSQVRGGAAEDALAAARGGPVVPEDVRTLALGAQAFGSNTVSVLDENGEAREVPREAATNPNRTVPLSAYPRAVPKGATTQEGLGLEKSTRASLEKQIIAFQDFNIVMDLVEDVAQSDPAIFGAVGDIKRFGQDVVGQAGALGSALGLESFESAAAQLQDAGVAPEFFDPNLPDVDRLATLAAFQAASALAQQTGRALSDRDFEVFRQILGDPTRLLSTQEKFLSGIKRMREIANRMMRARQNALSGESGAPETGGTVQGSASDIIFERDESGNLVRVQ